MRLFLLTLLAHLMVDAEALLERALPLLDPDGRLFRLVCEAQDRCDVAKDHKLAVLAHTVCYECTDLAPGWWDFDVDCSGHDCGYCATCVGEFAPARYQHDCTSGCHYLGQHGRADLYVCLAEGFAPCYIARYSNEGSDYSSGTDCGNGIRHPELAEAQHRHRNAIGVIRQATTA